MVNGSTVEKLVTVKVKATGPPGSGRLVGLGVLVTPMRGGTFVMVMVASSLAVAGLPSSSRRGGRDDVSSATWGCL